MKRKTRVRVNDYTFIVYQFIRAQVSSDHRRRRIEQDYIRGSYEKRNIDGSGR